MITPAYVHTMAHYNAEANRRWYAAAATLTDAQREMTKPRTIVVMHFFNHQIHHRGQAHALITALGAATGGTDLPFIL